MARDSVLSPQNAAADFRRGIVTHGKEIMADVSSDTNPGPQTRLSETAG